MKILPVVLLGLSLTHTAFAGGVIGGVPPAGPRMVIPPEFVQQLLMELENFGETRIEDQDYVGEAYDVDRGQLVLREKQGDRLLILQLDSPDR